MSINLFDRDERYDLEEDPGERCNRIENPALASIRDAMHSCLILEMDRIRDPFRCRQWANRPWHQACCPFENGGDDRPQPQGFPFQPETL